MKQMKYGKGQLYLRPKLNFKHETYARKLTP